MARLVPLGPVKPRYCNECRLIVSQLCTHVVDPVITTDTKRGPAPRARVGITRSMPLPTTPEQLEERARARKMVDLATPDITPNGQIVYRHVPKMKYCTSPYTRVYPRFDESGNIFGPLVRDFTDDRVYKEGSFTPRKRQPRKGKKAQKAQKATPKSKDEAVALEPEANAGDIVCVKPVKPVPTKAERQQRILALRKEYLDSRKGSAGSPKVNPPGVASTSGVSPYVLQVPKPTCESAGQA